MEASSQRELAQRINQDNNVNLITLSVITLSGLKCTIFIIITLSVAAVLKPAQAGLVPLTGLEKSKCNKEKIER